ncbi:MAG: bifunctional adenosylcobinamide kinase/adenosylcobinamide-phosphate guanylyltransferase [Nitrospirae bacterium]|nr:bifunctional adenosylcobinamide kinase/adenosylcobinamide-phosphate guanylyltransferase [Nitrospirota bacterium]
MKIIYISGGTRCGKSAFALTEALRIKGKRAFIATAIPIDEEMSQRINAHIKERGDSFVTIEQPLDIEKALKDNAGIYNVILIDCLTIWLSNVMERDIDNTNNEIERLIKFLNEIRSNKNLKAIYIVSNEVGMGIVPENKIARVFRDFSGKMNQGIASIADEAYFVVSGLPLKIKGSRGLRLLAGFFKGQSTLKGV